MATKKGNAQAVYNSAGITLTDGDETGLFVDASGNLLTASGGTGTGANQVQGTAADNAAAVGNPVLGGAKYFATPQTYSDGDVATNPTDINGNPIGVGAFMSVPFTTTTVQAVGTTDVGNYRWVSVHIVSQGTSSTVTFQGSNDNTNWVNVVLMNASNTGTFLPASSQTGASRIDSGPLSYRYFRLNVTGISAGTTAGTIVFSANPAVPAPSLVTAQQSGTWTTQAGTSSTSALTSVASSASSVQLLASNASRKAGYFFNESSAILYLAYAGSASTSAYTIQVAAGGFFEMPVPVYTGAIFGIWASANGNARITEGS